MKYKEILESGEQRIETAMIPFKVEQAKKQCELEICKTEEQIAQMTLAAERARNSHPINLKAIVLAQNDLELARKNLEIAKTVVKDLF